MFGKMAIVVMLAAVCGLAQVGGAGPAAAGQGQARDGTKLCPVSGDKIETPGQFRAVYQGKHYELCCAGCLKSFNRDPASYSGQGTGAAAPADPPHHAHD